MQEDWKEHGYDQHMINAAEAVENPYVKVEGNSVTFTIQCGPVKDFGKNGCDAVELINYARGLYSSFNDAFPCHENEMTIWRLCEASTWQSVRTAKRERRGVEGKDEA